MDAFYASVEQRNHPEWKGKPVIVGGDPKTRGVVATASYEARHFGVRSAMSCALAFRLCPHAIFVRPHFDQYQEASSQIRDIFKSVTDLVEPLSLDEAFLDVTQNHLNEPLARKLAVHIKTEIFKKTKLTASAGVGPNKFIAKIASELHKPNGLTVIPPEQVSSFVEKLAVEKLWGVGPATARKLHSLGFKTAGDIRKSTKATLEKELGKFGIFLFDLSFGIDSRAVESDSEPKSRGTETTFEKDISNENLLLEALRTQAQELGECLQDMHCSVRTITLKVKYSDFKSVTRSKTLINPTENSTVINQTATELLLNHTEAGSRPIRLLGISVSGFVSFNEPLQLWFEWD